MKFAVLVCVMMLAGCGKKSKEVARPSPRTDAAAPAEASNAQSLDRLTQAVRKYAAENRAAPKSLNEVAAAGYLPEVPQAPAGKQYIIDDQLRVQLK